MNKLIFSHYLLFFYLLYKAWNRYALFLCIKHLYCLRLQVNLCIHRPDINTLYALFIFIKQAVCISYDYRLNPCTFSLTTIWHALFLYKVYDLYFFVLIGKNIRFIFPLSMCGKNVWFTFPLFIVIYFTFYFLRLLKRVNMQPYLCWSFIFIFFSFFFNISFVSGALALLTKHLIFGLLPLFWTITFITDFTRKCNICDCLFF